MGLKAHQVAYSYTNRSSLLHNAHTALPNGGLHSRFIYVRLSGFILDVFRVIWELALR